VVEQRFRTLRNILQNHLYLLAYLHTDSARNLCGTVHKVASPEMLYCSSSSGEHFDRRARELRQSSSVVEGIILHANSRKDDGTENH
jgi:hypothetical protein